MGGMKVSELEFLRLLPAFMRDDEAAIALSKAMNRLIGEPSKRLKTLRVWDNIDNLNEAECDELAWELDVDWYDSTGMSLEEKQATLKIAQQIKRKRGTKWAVEQLISAYFGEGYIMEWYEMYGTPYTFVALTTNPHITAQNFGKFVEAVKAAKNVRSHLAGVFYFWQQGPDPGVEYAVALLRRETAKIQKQTDNETASKYMGMAVDAVEQAVAFTAQTFVDALKSSGGFTKEKQLEAFQKSKDKALEILGDTTVAALGEIYGDFDAWIETKIEQVCRDLKRPDTGEAATTAATTAAATAASVATTIAATAVQQLAGEAPATESTVEVEIEESTGKE